MNVLCYQLHGKTFQQPKKWRYLKNQLSNTQKNRKNGIFDLEIEFSEGLDDSNIIFHIPRM